MERKNYNEYWDFEDIAPINEAQRQEVEELKEKFISSFEQMSFEKEERVTIDPYERCLKKGEGELHGKVLFKWGPWEFNHIRGWVRKYLNMAGFVEVYHFYLRSPVGAVEFLKL